MKISELDYYNGKVEITQRRQLLFVETEIDKTRVYAHSRKHAATEFKIEICI